MPDLSDKQRSMIREATWDALDSGVPIATLHAEIDHAAARHAEDSRLDIEEPLPPQKFQNVARGDDA